MSQRLHGYFLGLLSLLTAACAGDRPEGLGETRRQGGPQVVFDIEEKPLPEVPLPNDAATRIDPSSPTGRRLNVSVQAPTALERDTRAKFDRLDGFGTFAPISVRFTAPLDVADIDERHNGNDDFRDDALYLLNVDPTCKRYGEEVALDLGRGRYPLVLYRHASRIPDEEAPGGYRIDDGGNTLFELDPRGDYNNLFFEERNEDANGNGRLDEGEDLDADGELDQANFLEPSACDGFDISTVEYDRCVADNLLTWYERETNTLIARPVWPLEQQCRYAMVITKRARGVDGKSVESPFPVVHHRDQTEALKPLPGLLSRYGLGKGDIAFAWSFTTGSQTRDLEVLRAGLYGHGKFARLGSEFPVSSLRFWTRGELADNSPEPDSKLVPGACGAELLNRLWARGIDEWTPNRCALEAELSGVGGIIGGSFKAPNLLVDRDGIATEKYPADDNEIWDMDWSTGVATYGESEVTFWCALPRELDTSCSPGNPEGKPFCKPFPTVLYAHGYGGSRNEINGFLGRHTTMGYAMCGVDSYGHGIERFQVDPAAGLVINVLKASMEKLGIPAMTNLLTNGRDRDLNNDGLPDSGGDMWSADIFHTRDMVRQSVLEYMQLVRMLRAMDGTTKSVDGSVLGDADGDGEPDIGGPDNSISMWGISLGGVLGGVIAGAEPSLDAVSPNAGGGGLSDIAARSAQAGVPEEVHLPVVGPFVMGCLPTDAHQNPVGEGEEGGSCLGGNRPGGELRLSFLLHDTAVKTNRDFGVVTGAQPGDRVVLENVDNGELKSTRIDARGRFRLAVESDALSPTERRPLLGLGDDDTEPVAFENTPLLADRLRLTIFVGNSDAVRATVDTFQQEVTFQGTIYPEGAPLVALQEGLGLDRNDPEYRRFLGLAQHALGPADPSVWSAHYFLEPLDVSYDPHLGGQSRMHVLVMPTLGDMNVPVNTGITNARTAGIFGSWKRDESVAAEHGWRELFVPDERYGKSVDQELIDTYVIEGAARLQRYPDNPLNPNALYDIDNVSDGNARFSCGDSDWSAAVGENLCPADIQGQEVLFPVPRPEAGKELRQNRPRGDGSFDAFRVPMLRPAGQHGIYNPQSFREYDADAHMVSFTVRFLGTRGQDASHEAGCDCAAAALGNITLDGEKQNTALDGDVCTVSDVKVCSPECAQAYGMRTPEEAACMP